MTVGALLQAERTHLAGLLEAVQCCVYFLDASDQKLSWPLSPEFLVDHKKDVTLFETMAAINERFAKLQDTLGAAMRHAIVLAGEPADTFLKALAFYEKVGVIESIEAWQLCRAARNLAAHDYETDYSEITEHFNSLHHLLPQLYRTAAALLRYCHAPLGVQPLHDHFEHDFLDVIRRME
jgi:hypothetical protein